MLQGAITRDHARGYTPGTFPFLVGNIHYRTIDALYRPNERDKSHAYEQGHILRAT
jgi:hypothetical protein